MSKSPIKEMTAYQERILAIPQPADRVLVINLLGARSSGKTVAGFGLQLRHAGQHGTGMRALVVRKQLKSLRQYMDDLLAFFQDHMTGVSMNHHEHTLSLHGQAVIQFAALESGNILEFSGRNHTALVIEEAGTIPCDLVDQLALTLRRQNRDPKGNLLPNIFVRAGNPGGDAHLDLFHRFIKDREPWVPYEEGGFLQVTIPGTLEDNPHNPENYADQFLGLRQTDEGLYLAHRYGDWASMNAGSYFGAAWSPSENVIAPGDITPGDFVRLEWCGDWGTAAPSVYLLLGRTGRDRQLEDGRIVPAGTYVVFDEYTTALDGSVSKGDGRRAGQIMPYLVQKSRLAGLIGEVATQQARGVLDCAVGANIAGHGESTILDFHNLASSKIRWRKAPKGDLQTRMETLREMIALRQILVVGERCPYLVATLPNHPRDKRMPNLIETRGAKHAIDALSYGISAATHGIVSGGSWK